jgi:hypothetical protein
MTVASKSGRRVASCPASGNERGAVSFAHGVDHPAFRPMLKLPSGDLPQNQENRDHD